MLTQKQLESFFSSFFKLEAASGILLMLAAVAALLCANSFLFPFYELLLSTPVEVRVGKLEIAKPLLLWINDGLMAVFFFVVGLELKRGLGERELAGSGNIVLPIIGAVGGMVCPALIYVYFNSNDPLAIGGWAIPTATDIAFSLGVLSLLGRAVPTSIKLFLTSLAIFDDIGAIIVIACFYTARISLEALMVVAVCLPLLYCMNRYEVVSKSAYIFVGIVMWIAMLKSGVHATLTGVLLALFVPLHVKRIPGFSPLKNLEHDLHGVVAFFVLPVFAFANAGINLSGLGVEQLLHGVPIGIAMGLFVGKQVGIFGLCWLAVKLGITVLPKGISWLSLYGTAVLCGIGFTMSLFIGSLAFEETGIDRVFDERLGILMGSLLSGVFGYIVLKYCFRRR